jgi:hypothetical protein
MTDTTELRAALVDCRESSLAAFQTLAAQRQRLEECAGWIPRLDAVQLLEVTNLLNETLTSMSALAIKWSMAADQLLLAIPEPTEITS